jgi:hypothetical protein
VLGAVENGGEHGEEQEAARWRQTWRRCSLMEQLPQGPRPPSQQSISGCATRDRADRPRDGPCSTGRIRLGRVAATVNWLQVATQLGPLVVGFVSVVGSLFWSSRVVAAKDGELKAKDGELKAKDGELKAKDGELKAKDGELKAKDGELKVKDGELKAKDAELKAKDAELKVKDAELAALANIFEQKQGLIELQARYEARVTIAPIEELGSRE